MNNVFGIRNNLYDEIINLFILENIEKAILFGSRSRGDFKSNSDIDLAIIFNDNAYDNYIKLLTKLENLNTLYKFDIIDFNRITNEKLKEEILKDGICIYKKK